MRNAEPGWGKYAVQMVYSRVDAERAFKHWEERAATIPGAEVRVMSWKNPLGGETFVFCTEHLELVPEEWRETTEQTLARISSLERTASPEDRDAFAAARKALQDAAPADGRRSSLDDKLRRLLGELDDPPDAPEL